MLGKTAVTSFSTSAWEILSIDQIGSGYNGAIGACTICPYSKY